MKKARRITITPREGLSGVPKKLQSRFAEVAAEILISDGRSADVYSAFLGLTASDLTEGPTVVTPGKATKQRKPNAALQVAQPGFVPAPCADYDNFRKMLQDPYSMPSIMLSIVTERGKMGWDELLETLDIDHGLTETDKLDGSLQMLLLDGHINVDGVGGNKIIIKTK